LGKIQLSIGKSGFQSHLVFIQLTHHILPAVLQMVSLMLEQASETPIAWKIIQLSSQLCPKGDSVLSVKWQRARACLFSVLQ